MAIPYQRPRGWIFYDPLRIHDRLVAAKAAALSLRAMPYQRSWAEELQEVQLKREVAGTSRIEGAEFTEKELDVAMRATPQELQTRSQRQAAATVKAYRWIARLPNDRPLMPELIREIHALIVTDADDDHCPPGTLRRRDENVTFGTPRHRGVEGGSDCESLFTELCLAVAGEFREHDPLVQALAFHYHLAAMHPFLDGNGRTARAVEALMLQRTGLRDMLFIAMSNYYYEEKIEYLTSLAEVRAELGNLTSFLNFGLRGIELQCQRLSDQIRIQVSKALFRNTMSDLFGRLKSARKRVIAERQLQILQLLLKSDWALDELFAQTRGYYASLKNPTKAFVRDLNNLLELRAISFDEREERFSARLEWPTEITETEFFERVKRFPKARTHRFF